MNNTHKALIVSSVLTIAVAIKHKFLNRKHKKLQKELENLKNKNQDLALALNYHLVDTNIKPMNDVSYSKK